MSGAVYWDIDAIDRNGKQHFFGRFDRLGRDIFIEDNRKKYKVINVAEYKAYINVGLSVYVNGKLIYNYNETHRTHRCRRASIPEPRADEVVGVA